MDKNQKAQRAVELSDLRRVLMTKEGRRVIWRIMEECRTFASVMTGNSWTHYNAGQQDLGHFIMKEVSEANEESLFLMMKENKLRGDNNNVRKPRSIS